MTSLTAYYNPLVNGVLGASQSLPQQMASGSYAMGPLSQLAYQMAGSPKLGPFPDRGTPAPIPGFPTAAGATGPGTGSGAGGIATGVLAALAKNPSLVKSAYNLASGLLGGGSAGLTAADLSSLYAAEPALEGVAPELASMSADATLPADVSGTLATSGTAADTGAAAGGGGASALGTLGGALGGAALGAGLLYGTASLFDMLDPNVQMSPQEMAALQPQQSPAEIAARQSFTPLNSNSPYMQYLTPGFLAAYGY